MTESAGGKPYSKRRRTMAGLVALVLILIPAVVWRTGSGGNSSRVATLSCVGFAPSKDGQSVHALMRISNGWAGLLYVTHHNDGETIPAWLEWMSNNGSNSWHPTNLGQVKGQFLPPGWVMTNRVLLPEDGQVGTLHMSATELPVGHKTLWAKVRVLLDPIFPVRPIPRSLKAGQEIQCPKRLPDGTVEPPRIISPAEGQP